MLIHSATGGVGQAAIAIARAAGAEIFATAGSEQRRELLRDMGIEHVYDSRSIEFAEQIRRDTDGYGVDIVLNSLTGAAQRAGLELLAFGGRFVEIGKRDIYGDTRLGLFPFRRNLTFYAVDLALMSVSHPRRVRDLLSTVYRLTADGALPMPAEHALPACRRRDRDPGDERGPAHRQTRARRSAHRAAAAWWCRRSRLRSSAATAPTSSPAVWAAWGCSWPRRWPRPAAGGSCSTSRSQPTPKALKTIERIRATGADVVVECGDIAEPGTAERLVATATATGLPLRGVLHAAAVVEDATLTNITDELIDRDWAPKVYGAWNLHACHRRSAAGLVLLVLLGGRAGGLARTGRLRRGQQLAGRLHPVAPGSGPAGHRDRVGCVGRDRPRHRLGGERRHRRSLPTRAPTRSKRCCATTARYTGYAPIMGTPWLTAFAQRSPFAEAFRSVGPKLNRSLANCVPS